MTFTQSLLFFFLTLYLSVILVQEAIGDERMLMLVCRYTSVMTQVFNVRSAILPVAVHTLTSFLVNIHRKANTSWSGVHALLYNTVIVIIFYYTIY